MDDIRKKFGLGDLVTNSDLFENAVDAGVLNPNSNSLQDYESFVVTNPDLVDPGIDVSGLRTSTDASILGNIPDYGGIQYEAYNPNRLSDLMRLYSGGFPMLDTPQATAPITTTPDTGGGGGMDQATTIQPIDTPIITDLTDDQINEFATEDTTMPPMLSPDMGASMVTDTTPVDTYTSPTSNVAPDGTTMADMTDDVDMNLIDQPFADTPVTLGSGNNALGLQDPQSLAIGPDGAVNFNTGVLDDITNIPERTLTSAQAPVEQAPPGIMNPYDPSQSTVLGQPGIDTIGTDDILDINLLNQETPQVVDIAAAEAAIARAREAEQALLDNQPQPFTGEPQAVNTILGPDGITYDAVTGLPVSDDPIMDSDLMAIRQQQNALPQEQQDPGFWEAARDNFIQTGEDIGGFFQDIKDKGFDVAEFAGTALLNLAGRALTGIPLLGTAINFIGGLPPRDPRQTALDEFYTTGEGAQYLDPSSENYIPGMENYNIVSGSDTLNKLTGDRLPELTFGLQDAYQDRIDTIENTLADKYGMTAAEIADVKAGSYTGDVDSDLLNRLNLLEEAKTKEKARLDIFSGDVDERDQMLEDIVAQNKAQAEADSIRLRNLTGDTTFDTSTPFDADTFDDDVNLTGTPPTGTITPLEDDFEFDTPTGINTGIKLGPRRLDQDLSTLGDDLSAELDDILGNNITGDSTLVADADVITTKLNEQKDKLEGIKNSDAYEFLNQEQKDQLEENLNKIKEDLKLKEIEGQTAGLITMTDATTGDDDLIDTGTVTTGSGNNPFGYTDPTSTFDAEEEDEIYEPPTPSSPPTGTDRPGGDSRDDSPAPSPSPTTSQGVTTSQFQAFRDTGGGGGQDSSSTPSPSAPSSSSPSTGRGRTDAQSQYGGSSYSGGGGGGGGGCFLAGTLITMADGSTKEVQKVDLGDNVAEGGKVFATGKFLVENLHDYKGIKVSGSHMVNENNNWVRVEDSKHGKSLGDNEHTVYVFGSENRRILINDILFTDYFETTEQEKLINDEKDFFNNWKTYENKIDQDNINILNAS